MDADGQDAGSLRQGPRRALDGYGRAVASVAVTYVPENTEEVTDLLERANAEGLSVTIRGAGRSYGDAAINEGGVVLDLRKLNRVLSWDPTSGIIEVEPGATIEDLWRTGLPDGWWPTVVPGTMFPTIGGCVAMNIHGKNHFRVGGFGDQVLDMDILCPTGQRIRCSRDERPDIFGAVVGGLGVLGITTRVRLQMKRVHSGHLQVEALSVPDLNGLFDQFESRLPNSDYLVGWLDCFPGGNALGRGVIHAAHYAPVDKAPGGERSLSLDAQSLPDRFFGVIPRRLMWRLLHPWVNNFGMRLVNLAKYWTARMMNKPGKTFLQSHVAFAFLLDYVPRWRDAYGKGGFIQVQPFVPADRAREAFRKILETCQAHGIIPYLGVFKRHRPDEFLLSHALDGYSLALDIRVTEANRERVWSLGQAIGDIVVEAGGRFYFAKDAVARSDQVAGAFGSEAIERFTALKRELDPRGLLSSQLSRRILPALSDQPQQTPEDAPDAPPAPPAPDGTDGPGE
ncbi:MAG: FAD-binding oxidoreductase [Myxococcota bacterium]|nr:FAD-binding oxidoreductase [Myxococcota bacterium]